MSKQNPTTTSQTEQNQPPVDQKTVRPTASTTEHSYQNFRQSQEFKARCYSILRSTTLIGGLSILVGSALMIVLGLVVSQVWWLMLFPLGLWLLAAIIVFFSVNAQSERNLRFCSYLLLFAGLVVILGVQLLTGSLNTVVLAYVWCALLAALVGLLIKEIIAISIIYAIAATSTILAEKLFKLYTPVINLEDQYFIQAFILLTEMGIIVGAAIVLVQSLYKALDKTEQRAYQLSEASQALTENSRFGSQVSGSLSKLVTELNTTSNQQASGAHEQAAAVTQAAHSLNELAGTARQIATNTSQVAQAASSGLERAEEVRETSERATNTAQRGQAALESSIGAIEEVRDGIGELAERLMKLSVSSKQIRLIITLIKEISDETHLLALNAAIESAGSEHTHQRFSVIATEVKSLADRSLEATSEVTNLINDLQGAVATAVLSSEETRKKTFGAVERSYQAGQVIGELKQVVEETARHAKEIVTIMQKVATLSEEIKYATQQQESASQQLITTMDSVGTVAQQSASAISQLYSTVNQVDRLADQLDSILSRNQGLSLQSTT